MTMINTKIASIDDVEVTAQLFDAYRQFYEQAPNLALATTFIHDRIKNAESIIILAINEQQQAIGFCQLYPSFCSVEAKPIYVLYDLFVAPAARRFGAGKILLQKAEHIAREKGMCRMDLTTAKSNKPAQTAYETLGWIRDEVFYTYNKHID